MKKFLIAVLLLILTSASASEGEKFGYWSRQIVLGYDSDSYYFLDYESAQEGNPAEYWEQVFWCKYSNVGGIIERKLIRKTVHTFVTDENKWVTNETVDLPLDIMSMLIESGARLALPMNANDKTVFLQDDGIHCDNTFEDAVVVPSERISQFIVKNKNRPGFAEYSKANFKLVGVYSGIGTMYFVLQYGGPLRERVMECHRTGQCRENMPENLSYQVIIPLSLADMPRARELVVHKVRSGDNISKIAVKYGVTVNEIMRWNKLKNADHVFIGQKLKIYK